MEINPTSDQLSTTTPAHTDVATTTPSVSFGRVLGGAVNVAGQLASTMAGGSTLGAGPLAGGLANVLNGGAGGAGGSTDSTAQLQDLLTQQEQIQQESQVFTMLSNTSKTHSDTYMNVIRNLHS